MKLNPRSATGSKNPIWGFSSIGFGILASFPNGSSANRQVVLKDTKSLLANCYPRVARDLLRPLINLCRRCVDINDGDLTKFLVMLVVAQRTTMHQDFAARAPEELISGDIPVFPCLPTSVRSIAETLGLPKETVRRKVAELADAGWLVREHGRLYATAASFQQLAPVREQIVELAARNYATIAALKISADQPTE